MVSTTTQSTVGDPSCTEVEPFTDFENAAPGPFFVCSVTTGPLRTGGQVFERPEVESAEDAILEWAKGPNDAERELGYDGFDLAQYDWFVESVSFERHEDTLTMHMLDWEPINNLSTSYGSQLFVATLVGTAFSDPSVESFIFTILGDQCPQIGEGEICFPVARSEFLAGAIG